MTIIKTNTLHHIESNRVLQIARIKIYDILYPFFRNIVQQITRSIAVRINESNSPARLNILDGHIFQKFRLTHSSRSDNINVPSSIILFDTKTPSLITK